MSIGQFFRILWAYRLLILALTVFSLTVATITVYVLKPSYSAQSRVMLDVIRPDPVTGQTVSAAYLRAYTKTQTEMIQDQQVALRVVKDLGWENNAALKRQYQERSSGRDLDFTAWAMQQVQDGTKADVIMGSNILEISYSSPSPETAKKVADALMKAYMDLTLENRRAQARRNAEWYEAQAEKAKTILFAAEAKKAAFERESGVVLQADSTDLESARLQAIAGMGSAPVISSGGGGASASAAQLSLLDAEIAEQTKTLGPNHPTLQQLKIRRGLLATQVAQERAASAGAASAAANAARATSGLLEAQKAKVMAQREQVERARLMQDEINLRREQYKQSVGRAAQLRQEAEVAEAGVTPLANAVTPQSPDFPKKALTIGVSIPAGAALGVLIALLLELVGRRVRSADDLGALVSAPVLAVVYRPEGQRKVRRWTDIFRPIVPGVRRPARA
jgi:succinoglycan biosynthesis transport protein ExoP